MQRRIAFRCIPFVMLGLLQTQPVLALDIQLSFSDDIANRPAARSAMERTVGVWERTLRDPVTVQIDVFEASPAELDGALGGTAITYDFIDYSYADFRNALLSDATTANDTTASSHLQTGPHLAFRTWDVDKNPTLLDGDEWANNYLSVPRATAKALGLPHENEGPDAEIYWNTSVLDSGFDFDRFDGIDGTDFMAVAMHEIGHALGFTSGVGFVEEVFTGDIPIPPESLPELPLVEPLDLLRYSAASVPYMDLSPGGNPYFSIDGGVTNLAAFASGEVYGNGDQPDHWQDGSGIMDAYLDDDLIHNLSELDLLALDVIGWDLSLPGDFDGNGLVDAADYIFWRDGLGTTYVAADYDVWRANFGAVRTASAGQFVNSAAAAPEPASAFILIIGAACIFVRQKRHH